MRVFNEIHTLGANRSYSDRAEINRQIGLYSHVVIGKMGLGQAAKNRVADFTPIYRAYISPCRNCKICRNNDNDCRRNSIAVPKEKQQIREPRPPIDFNRMGPRFFSYG